MTTERTQKLIRADKEHQVHPWWVVGQEISRVFEKGHGIYLVDTEGREYMDLASQLVCSNLGHHCPEIIEAITAALANLHYVTNFYGHYWYGSAGWLGFLLATQHAFDYSSTIANV